MLRRLPEAVRWWSLLGWPSKIVSSIQTYQTEQQHFQMMVFLPEFAATLYMRSILREYQRTASIVPHYHCQNIDISLYRSKPVYPLDGNNQDNQALPISFPVGLRRSRYHSYNILQPI